MHNEKLSVKNITSLWKYKGIWINMEADIINENKKLKDEIFLTISLDFLSLISGGNGCIFYTAHKL